jgi:KaiC/GvpD/RAD55 family RecA-like ATPase
MCRGGFPIPWRVVIVGAPSAGKTASAAAVGFEIARELGCVGFLAVDEEPDDITIRLAQMVGFTVADAEQRDPEVLSDLAAALEPLHVRLYDGDFTIDAAAEDLGAWASSIGLPGVLIVDSLQTARSNRVTDTMTAREQVEANVSALRAATKKYRLLTIATSEANRNAYRSEQAEQNDLAAGAETRAIEFGAQTLLVLRTPKDSPDVVHVKVSKNRRAQRGEFWLRIDRETHALTECANPADNPEASQKRADEKRERDRARVERDANELIRVAARAPGLSERDLRTAAKVAGLGWGRDRFEIAKRRCIEGTPDGRLVNRGDDRASRWFVEHMQEEHGAPPSGVPSVPGTVPGTPKQENGHGRW